MLPRSHSYHTVGSKIWVSGHPPVLFSIPLNGAQSGCRAEEVEGRPVCQARVWGASTGFRAGEWPARLMLFPNNQCLLVPSVRYEVYVERGREGGADLTNPRPGPVVTSSPGPYLLSCLLII